MKAKSWTREDEQRLLELAREPALTQREIAQKIGRSEAAVNFRLARLRRLDRIALDLWSEIAPRIGAATAILLLDG